MERREFLKQLSVLLAGTALLGQIPTAEAAEAMTEEEFGEVIDELFAYAWREIIQDNAATIRRLEMGGYR